MNDVPRNAVSRTAKLAGLPIGFAGRTALGIGKRIGGRSAELVAKEIQQRTADQIFRVLGELKGGAMKLGQALSIFEAALPPELAEPYRATLTKLQESAPPLPASSVHRVLAADLGRRLAVAVRLVRRLAGRGRVHRPGAPGRLAGRQAGRGEGAVPGRRAGPDQRLHAAEPGWPPVRRADARAGCQAAARRAAGPGRRRARLSTWKPSLSRLSPTRTPGTRTSTCRRSSRAPTTCSSPSGWTARRYPRSSATGRRRTRDRAGILLARFLFSGPARAGLLHADPHPGNFRLLDDGRLGVLDFGAVDRLPDGLPPFFGRLLRIMHDPDPDIAEVERELRANGFLRPGISVDLEALRAFLGAACRAVFGRDVQVQPGMDARGGRTGDRPERV